MKRIAIEEHVWVNSLRPYLENRRDFPRIEAVSSTGVNGLQNKEAGNVNSTPVEIINKLTDLKDIRLKQMDQYGIDVQILSSTLNLACYGSEGVVAARQFNDGVAEMIKDYPSRFAAFATISPYDPEIAAEELGRSVEELGFKGVMISSSLTEGEYWDDEKYKCIFKKAAELNVPVYVHPAYISPDMLKAFLPYTQLFGDVWGFAVDTGLAAMRLVCSGIFDECPGLKIILGHLGEALPFWLWRIDNRWEKRKMSQNPSIKKLLKKPGDYIKENFYITTSGMLYGPALDCAIKALGVDRIMFAVDYPWEPMNEAVDFMDRLQINNEDKEKMYHKNAEVLLKL